MFKAFSSRLRDHKPLIPYFLVLIYCYFTYQHGDIIHTAGSSMAYVFGHFSDFYEFNAGLFEANNYLPSTYALFAIWNLPLKIFGILPAPTSDDETLRSLVMWFKGLPVLFMGLSAYLMFHIGKALGLKDDDRKALVIAWITSPLLIFSQFIFGQYDVFTTFFALLGLYYWLQGRLALFAIAFGASLTFKYFPAFLFFPLLFLVEKRYARIFKYSVLLLAPLILEVILYSGSPAFKSGVFGFSATARAFDATIDFGISKISWLLLFWALICGYAFLLNPTRGQETHRYGLYLTTAASSVIFMFLLWHPQWLLFITPYLVLTTVLHRNSRELLALEGIAMIFFFAFVWRAFPFNVDMALMNLGVFAKVNPLNNDSLAMFLLDKHIPFPAYYFFTFFVGFLVLNLLVKFPAWSETKGLPGFSAPAIVTASLRRFYLGIGIFVVPTSIAFFVGAIPSIQRTLTQPIAHYLDILPERDAKKERFLTATGHRFEFAVDVPKSRIRYLRFFTHSSKKFLETAKRDTLVGRIKLFSVEDGAVLFDGDLRLNDVHEKNYSALNLGRTIELSKSLNRVKFELDFSKAPEELDLRLRTYEKAGGLNNETAGIAIDGQSEKVVLDYIVYGRPG